MTPYTRHILDAPDTGGAFDIVGDVHGCHAELLDLLSLAGWVLDPAGIHHPEGRHLVFAGDLTDRGPASASVLVLAMDMIAAGRAHWVMGNHDWKLYRALLGNDVKIGGGLQGTLDQIAVCGETFAARVRATLSRLPHQIRLPMPEGHPRGGDGVMTVVHGAAPAHHLDGGSRHSFDRSIYGYGQEADADGCLVREDWASAYEGIRWIAYGHEPHADVTVRNRVIALDTGCVFGNRLSLYRADSMEVLQAEARANWSGKSRSFR